jgi:HAD superfamily hydrolase (TIGR01509 family)
VIEAFLFDFNATLIRSRTWIELEVRDLPRAAFALLASQGHVPLLDRDQLARVEAIFRAARDSSNRTNVETSHLEDLAAMVEALGLGEQVPPALVEETVATLHRRCISTVELLPNVAEMLRQLQDVGLRLGIVSNAAYPPFLTWTLDHFGILDYFEDIVVSADVQTRKPGLEIFRIALDRMGLQSEGTAYVGDDYVKDVAASRQFGLRPIWYCPAGDAVIPDGEPSPDAIVADHADIPPLAKKWRDGA